ncbi:hypothetical protein NQ318_000724 [Aromia moschata]|uniref:Tc1-like transposase DDE domain-containing protein n=1 Tax=Aromia moschata TaxID=1265417 RepID=A0AAV8XUI3_9CUCU|nr:hypothetical protein NQ318_000724 [Aromia moschata]
MLDPYHYTPVQQLLPQDLPARLQLTQCLQNVNNDLWDSENPHPVSQERHFQRGVIYNFVIGPFELPPNLTGPRHLNCSQHHLNELLEVVPLALRENVADARRSATTFCLASSQNLHLHFRHRWIDRGSKLVWPPRSPNLNPLDFSLWSNFMDLDYQEKVNSLQELWQRIQQAANTFKNNRKNLFNIQRYLHI